MGSLRGAEALVATVFAGICLLWLTSGWHHIDVALVALGGLSVLLLSNILTWESALNERAAWDVFVWYGGLMTLGEALNATGSTTALATWIGGWFAGVPWFAALLVTLLIYFYAHYAFASISTHVLAMLPPFLVMLIALDTPPLLAAFSLACFANLTAGLTHYGTTTAPIVFAENYLDVKSWWKAGFIVSLVNIAVWIVIGFAWWKLLKLW